MAFVWGDGGAQLTPEGIAAQRKVAQAMMQRGGDYSPVQSAWQGAARMAEGLMGGYQLGQLDRAEKANTAYDREYLSSILPGATAAPSTAPASVATPMGATSIPAGKEGFVSTIMPMAMEASKKTGIAPEIIVAQAALESGWGKSAPGNNLFGIKSHGQPGGNTLATTEVVNGQPVRTTDSFRAYASPADSVNGYADFMMQNPRYAALRSAQGIDAQLGALGKSGYATDPMYADKVGAIARGLNATSATPAAPVAPAATPASSPFANVNPRLIAGMSDPRLSDGTKKILGVMLEKQMAADKVQTVDLGNKIAVMDSRGNITREIAKGEPNKGPEFGVIGKDEFGNEQYGWRDSRSQTTTPVAKPAATSSQPSAIPPVPAGVDPKVWREKNSERLTKDGMPASSEETSKLRNEVQGLPSYKNVAQAAPVYRSMLDAAGRDNRAADVNMIYGMAKIMDPGSVVRESEMTVAQAIATLPQQLRATVQSQLTGDGRLTPDVRAAIMGEARSRMLAYQGMFDQDAGMYRGIAGRSRMNVDDVLPNFGTFDEYKPAKASAPPPAPATEQIAINPKTGERIILKNGKWVPLA